MNYWRRTLYFIIYCHDWYDRSILKSDGFYNKGEKWWLHSVSLLNCARCIIRREKYGFTNENHHVCSYKYFFKIFRKTMVSNMWRIACILFFERWSRLIGFYSSFLHQLRCSILKVLVLRRMRLSKIVWMLFALKGHVQKMRQCSCDDYVSLKQKKGTGYSAYISWHLIDLRTAIVWECVRYNSVISSTNMRLFVCVIKNYSRKIMFYITVFICAQIVGQMSVNEVHIIISITWYWWLALICCWIDKNSFSVIQMKQKDFGYLWVTVGLFGNYLEFIKNF